MSLSPANSHCLPKLKCCLSRRLISLHFYLVFSDTPVIHSQHCSHCGVFNPPMMGSYLDLGL